MSKSYPAKILLYGEHTVLRGGRGLAVPYPEFSLRWVRDRPDDRLLAFCDYLQVAISNHLLRTAELEDYLLTGGRLAGNIPTGYGLGSSGAVCAAIWSRFATREGKALTGENLRAVLARMEGHFHGQSSGTDPLICYLDRPVTLGGGAPPTVTKLPEGWQTGFFLLDTGKERKADEYIRAFTKRYDGAGAAAHAIDRGWKGPADAAIDALLADDREKLREHHRRISTFQRASFADFIPESLHEVWSGETYALKLCGAGGGGMMLGLARDKAETEEQLGEVRWL